MVVVETAVAVDTVVAEIVAAAADTVAEIAIVETAAAAVDTTDINPFTLQ
jgi:hypothetical protein